MNTSSIIKVEPLSTPWKAENPFIFCAYHRNKYPKVNANLGLNPNQIKGHGTKNEFKMYHGSVVPGFPYPPHSGFETVKIAVEGVIDHCDSLGGAGGFMNGDVNG